MDEQVFSKLLWRTEGLERLSDGPPVLYQGLDLVELEVAGEPGFQGLGHTWTPLPG